MKLSIIIPVFNEGKTIAKLIKRVLQVNLPVAKEIIIIDDGSADNSAAQITEAKKGSRGILFLKHKKNMGKGTAVRTGLKHAKGNYVIIQDADLEYDPKDIIKLLKPILDKKAKVVYGTRLKRLPNLHRDERTAQFMLHYFGNKLLSLLTSILYFHWVTDMETCYKLFPRDILAGVTLREKDFAFEPEITAKIFKKGYGIYEVPISTNPRTPEEGKKLHTIRDGSKALWTLLKYRFID